ncbi:TolC family protein [Candidatus Albibeggiatoa sp. nov. NOAA]|uniref:TolC family protein n=1 Tax=Candidatus Albibeggiatoa sp. nov. NOAA TaxID=3162724 RepID=UPI003300EF9C|nr:TolC family protein [Thiotrichaceae bacterium]
MYWKISKWQVTASTLLLLPTLGVAEPKAEWSGGSLGLMDAAQLTIKNSPKILLQTLAVDAAKAGEQIQAGAFDWTTYATIGGGQERIPRFEKPHQKQVPTGARLDHDLFKATAGISKLFRNGMVSNFSVNMVKNDPYLTDINPALNFDNARTINTSTVKFTLKVPFLKGAGTVSANANEKAAQLNRKAAESTFEHFVTSTLLSTVQAYWNYKAAQVNLKVQTDSKERVTKIINRVEDVVSKQSNPSQYEPDLQRLYAYLADKKRNLSEAEEMLNSNRNALATSLGIPAAQAGQIGFAEETFSDNWVDVAKRFDKTFMQDYLSGLALQNRLDLKASELKHEASATKLAKARKDLLPSLDLNLTAASRGLEFGSDADAYFSSLHERTEGYDATAYLSFRYQLGNNRAKGSLLAAKTAHQRTLISFNELKRKIKLQMNTSVGTLERALKQVEDAKQSADLYEKSFLGFKGSITDNLKTDVVFQIMDTETKLIEAKADYVSALFGLANTIASLRFQTGTLVNANDDIQQISLQDVTTLPEL